MICCPIPWYSTTEIQVRTASEWEAKRRAEIIELFDREIYGRVPADVPGVTWEVVSVKDTMEGVLSGPNQISDRPCG